MSFKQTFFITICCVWVCCDISAQRVTVSKEISIRNNVAYDIIGRIDDKILLYKDKGTERDLLTYDNDLVFQSERQITLDEKRCVLFEVVQMDTAFAVIYGYRKKGDDIIKMDVFSPTANRVDSTTLLVTERKWKGLDFETSLSEDERHLVLFDISGDSKVRVVSIDLEKKELVTDKEYVFDGLNLYRNALQFEVDNEGRFYMLADKNNTKGKREDHSAHVYQFVAETGVVNEIQIPLNDFVTQDVRITINNRTNELGVAGLYDEKRQDESTGYFWIKGDKDNFSTQSIELVPFDEDIYFEVYGERHRGRMENVSVADIIWKSNSTPILIFELAYDVRRRNLDQSIYGGGVNRRTGYSGDLAWSDHYRDDLILISLDQNNGKEWHQVFYKKQFSQNDNAIFSSFFPFTTPSRLRLIYNDEIKNNSTVSEYILDPFGNYKRTSVLSTEYQNLRLRFIDANQISPTEILVPSQKSYGLNLVKIDYSE